MNEQNRNSLCVYVKYVEDVKNNSDFNSEYIPLSQSKCETKHHFYIIR